MINKRSSSTTQLLLTMCSDPKHSWESEGDTKENFSFILANSFELRKKAYQLANESFYDLGYVDEHSKYIVGPHDCDEDTFTLLVLDAEGDSIGTISLYFDKYDVLPCDEVFDEEMFSLRGYKKKIAEIVRLAVAPEYRCSKHLITRMFNMAYIYVYHVMKYTDLVIEVKRNHSPYYKKLLGFNIVGETRPCLRVNNTIANLLHIKLSDISDDINLSRSGNKKKKIRLTGFNKREEDQIIEYFFKEKSPMTKREMSFYEISVDQIIRRYLDYDLIANA